MDNHYFILFQPRELAYTIFVKHFLKIGLSVAILCEK